MKNSDNSKYKFLGINYFFKDLASIKRSHLIILIIVGLFLVASSLFDFGEYFNRITPFGEANTKDYQKVLQGISGLIAFAGIMNVYLVGVGKISNYFGGIISVSTYGVYAFSVAYTGDAILNLLFNVPFQFVGFALGRNSMSSDKSEVAGSKMKLFDGAGLLILVISLFAIFGFLIPVVDTNLHKLMMGDKDYTYPFDKNLNLGFNGQGYLAHVCDALTNTLTIVAAVWMLKRFKNQGALGIIINIIQITMFVGLNGGGINVPMLVMGGFFLVNAIYAFGYWTKNISKNLIAESLTKIKQ